MNALCAYVDDDSDDAVTPDDSFIPGDSAVADFALHLQPSTSNMHSQLDISQINVAPTVYEKEDVTNIQAVHNIDSKELTFNPKFDDLFAAKFGPENPFRSKAEQSDKNMLSGYVEPAELSHFQFENQRRTFHSFGYADNPSIFGNSSSLLGSVDNSGQTGVTVFQSTKKRLGDMRKRIKNMDSSDISGYTGPWGDYIDEEKVSKPDAETMKELEEFARKRKKFQKVTRDDTCEEKSILHVKDAYDYQGRSWLHAPHDIGVNLRSAEPPDRCFVPKRLIHTWTGHTKGVQTIRWFPKTAHLLLSCSMDCKIKIWEVYNQRRCIRTFSGHRQAVRDICFSNEGNEFLSASYDRFVKLWDTESGICKQRFTSGKVPYCVKFNPDEDKQHMVLAGMADKKIIQWDVRSGEVVQEYDRHLGAVNTITFFDQNRRFCTTSDDKTMRIWEWEIPVDTKLIQDSSLHSMPSITTSPNGKWLACQAMDNRVVLFQVIEDKVRFAKKKAFKGHMVAGYACSVDFSPEMTFLISGDADGRIFVWDWKTHRIAAKWKAHDKVCIGVLWHPHETSKIASCGWDGVIKFWD